MTPPVPAIDDLVRTGLSFHRRGDFKNASICYEDILRQDSRNFPATYFLGLIAAQTDQHGRAVELIGRAVALNPRVPEAHYNQGNALLALGRHGDALASFDRAVDLKPDYAEAWSNRGTALLALEHFGEAQRSFDTLLVLRPNDAAAHYNRGVALEALGHFDAALASYDRAIAFDPRNADAHLNRGVVLAALARNEDELASYDRAIALKPDHAEAWSNRGSSLFALARVADALESCDRAIAIDPNHADARHNRSFCHLLAGDFARGLPDYEWRKRKRAPVGNRAFAQSLWLGTPDLAGKTILVHDEQGYGDTIQFSRYLPMLRERGARVLFAPKPELKALMRSLGEDIAIVDLEDGSLDFDVHCPLMSLPLAFGTMLDTIPRNIEYLSADPERAAHWATRIGPEGFRIGICWQGTKRFGRDERSFPLSMLASIARSPEVRLISLLKGDGEAELAGLPAGMVVETLGKSFDAGPDAFADTAAAIMACDLVISSDTAVAHLAGVLAKPVWVALKHVPDWRWLLDRSDSPWYPTARLFRQPARGDWASVIDEIEQGLKGLL